jgi:hypothetical protein
MAKAGAALLALVAATLLALGLLIIWLNTGREGTPVSNEFAIPFAIGAAAMLGCSVGGTREGRWQEVLTWTSTGILAALLWGAIVAAAV